MKRLREIVVASGLEPANPVGHFRLGGQEEDGRIDASSTRLLAQREPVHARQHHVENHELVARIPNPLQRLPAVANPVDVEALGLQVEADAGGEVLLVLDEQDPHLVFDYGSHDAAPAACRLMGHVTRNTAPRPGPSLLASTSPPSSVTKLRTR